MDVNETAAEIVKATTTESTGRRYTSVEELMKGENVPPEIQRRVKNLAAVELGRLGGLKGGKARADKLSKERRSEIAKQAAEARWAKE